MDAKEEFDLDLGRYFLILLRHWFQVVGIFSVTLILIFLATTRLKRTYEAQGKLLFKLDSTAALIGLGESVGELQPIVASQNPLTTEIEVIYSYPLLKRTIDQLGLKNEEGEPLKVQALSEKLSVKIIGGTDVVRLSYMSRNPKEAAAVVNTLMQIYIQNDIATKQGETTETQNFIENQIPATQADVREAEAALRQFKEENNVIALQDEAREAVVVMRDLDIQIALVQGDLEQATARARELQRTVNLSAEEALAISDISQSEGIQQVLRRLVEVETKLATQRSVFEEAAPTVIELRDELNYLRQILDEQMAQVIGNNRSISSGILQIGDVKRSLIKDFIDAEAQRLGYADRLRSLYQSRLAYERRTNLLPQLQEKQRELERNLEAAQSTYQTLLESLKKIQVKQNEDTANARIIEEAIPPEKGSSGRVKILLLGVFLAGFLSTGTVLFLELRDSSLKTIQEAREVFPYPLLGLIPLFGKKSISKKRLRDSPAPEIPVIATPYSLVSEMYRMMQANLKFLSSDQVIKVIVVSSSIPKEGKSTVAANLAATMAQLGRRILLIDADMRQPSQHHAWNLTNVVGLSEVLVGQATLEDAMCPVMENLTVLTAGVIPPNPLALLDSKRMSMLIQGFAQAYDYVIIDTPPLVLAADAISLSQMADGILLVVRPGIVDYSKVKVTQEILERAGHPVLGLVVNGVIQKNESTSYFYHQKERVEEKSKTLTS